MGTEGEQKRYSCVVTEGLEAFGSFLQCALAVQVAMVLLFETLFRSPLATHHMLQLVLSSGLDICGLRLLYPQQDVLLSSSGEV